MVAAKLANMPVGGDRDAQHRANLHSASRHQRGAGPDLRRCHNADYGRGFVGHAILLKRFVWQVPVGRFNPSWPARLPRA